MINISYDFLPELAAPRYDISKNHLAVYLDQNKSLVEFNNSNKPIFECPLIHNLCKADIINFNTLVASTYKFLKSITVVNGGHDRGKGIFAIIEKSAV
jgi:hypothetical protein